MRIVRLASLAILAVLTMVGSGWADSVTQNMVLTQYNVTQSDINHNIKLYESSKVLQSEFQAGKNAYNAGILAQYLGLTTVAQADFKTALSDFSQVANGVSGKMPDAGSIGLLSCTGLMLFGALKRKFSR
jgi:hypothetical protein